MPDTALDKIMDTRKELVDKIIENMKHGYIFSPALWSNLSIRPYNPASGCCYRGGNLLRLFQQIEDHGYKDPRWCTFKQASDNGWKIKKGEHGTLLEKWIFSKEISEKNEAGQIVKRIEKLKKPVVNYFYVFNAEQISGVPEFAAVKKEPSEIEALTEKVMQSSKCPITECAQPKAFYRVETDQIYLPLRSTFKSPESFLSVCLHEMGHSTGHPSRLHREFSGDKFSPAYAREELTAELSSAFTGADLGIPLSGELLNDHSNYLKSWISMLKEDPTQLFRVCRQADAASSLIYGGYQDFIHKQTQGQATSHPLSLKMQEMGYEPVFVPGISDDFLMWKNISTGEEFGLEDWPDVAAFLKSKQLAPKKTSQPFPNTALLKEQDPGGQTPAEAPRRYTFDDQGRPERLWNGKSAGEFSITDRLQFSIDTDISLHGKTSPETLELVKKSGFSYQNGHLERTEFSSSPLRIIQDIQKSGFQPTPRLCRNIQQLQQAARMELTMKDLCTMYKSKSGPAYQNPEMQKLIEAVGRECQAQELVQIPSQ